MHCDHWKSTTEIAIKFAKIAVEHDPKAALAHFILAKNLRTLRRCSSKFKLPENDEIYHFTKAYELIKNPQFGILLAQSLKELRNLHESEKIFEELNNMNVQSVPIQLKLAKNFLFTNQFANAKKCLDYIESVDPNNFDFLYQRGLYFFEKMQYEVIFLNSISIC